MSRSALWRSEQLAGERDRQSQDVFRDALEEGRNNRSKGLVPLYGSPDTFNLNPVLLQAISRSHYFLKCCREIHDWNRLVDEIYYEVKHLEPWTLGANKSPSTAFCLLLRLFTLRCSEKQMKLMLDHVDSPFIRCIGFLYLRYACEPRQLWDWVEPYLYDEEPVRVEANQTRPETTVGEFVRSLLTEMDFYGTRLPRLPIQTEREIKVKLLQAKQIEDRAKQHSSNSQTMQYFQKLGSRVRALYGDEENPVTWYDAVVDRVISKADNGEPLARPKFVVTFPEYGNTETVTLGEMDMPGGGGAVVDDSRRGGGDRFERRRYADEDRRKHRRYEDRGDRRHGSYGSRGYDNRDGDGRRDRDYRGDRWERDRYRGRERGPDYDSKPLATEKDLMEQVIRQEKEKSLSRGGSYASRPPTARGSYASGGARHHGSTSYRHSPEEQGRFRSDEKPSHAEADDKPKPAPKRKTAEELAAIAEKKRKLVAKYG